jgi:CheY-like chemotaxis protein
LARSYNGNIDLLLTDVVMPHMSGPELARQIRGRRGEMRLLYASGSTENTSSELAVQEPGVGFLAKPFSREALGRKLRELLE